LWHPSLKDNPMQISKDTVGLHTVYRLRDETLDEVIGEAVVSELEAELRLHGIFVKPEHRGRGHAKSLMKSVLSLGEAKPITLCTGLGNIAFFKQFGFEVTEIGETLVHMQKHCRQHESTPQTRLEKEPKATTKPKNRNQNTNRTEPQLNKNFLHLPTLIAQASNKQDDETV